MKDKRTFLATIFHISVLQNFQMDSFFVPLFQCSMRDCLQKRYNDQLFCNLLTDWNNNSNNGRFFLNLFSNRIKQKRHNLDRKIWFLLNI